MNIVFLGAPGAGKSTQSERVAAKLGLPVVGTGNLVRAESKKDTPEGEALRALIATGRLASDELVIRLLEKRIAEPDCENGFVLEGFPRNLAQAKMLDERGIGFSAAVDIAVSNEVLSARLGGRQLCPKCAATFHTLSKPPKTPGVCDLCGEALTVRADDTPEAIARRLEIYHTQTEPLCEHFKKAGVYFAVDGTLPIDEITETIAAALESLE